MKLSKERRAELKALAEKATAGPWLKRTDSKDYVRFVVHGEIGQGGKGVFIAEVDDEKLPHEQCAQNAAFIAASRQALPDALADIEELEARNAEAELEALILDGGVKRLNDAKLALESKLADAVKALEVAIGIAYENGVDFKFYGFKCDDDAEQLCRAALTKLRAK